MIPIKRDVYSKYPLLVQLLENSTLSLWTRFNQETIGNRKLNVVDALLKKLLISESKIMEFAKRLTRAHGK